jgi:transposase
LDAQTVTVPAETTIARRDALAAEIEEAFLAHPFGELLSSMPGIGPQTGSRILAEIGDGTRFVDGDKLASYAGLAPVTRQSGKSINGESKSRRGNHRLKDAMFLAAFAPLRAPGSKAFYDRKRAEGKRHKAAVICLARRHCNVILAMLRTHQPYQASRAQPELTQAA